MEGGGGGLVIEFLPSFWKSFELKICIFVEKEKDTYSCTCSTLYLDSSLALPLNMRSLLTEECYGLC